MKITWKRDMYSQMEWWQGFCWFDVRRNQGVVSVIGLNLLLRIARAFWIFMLHPIRFFDVVYEAKRLEMERKKLIGEIRRMQNAYESLAVQPGNSDAFKGLVEDNLKP